jgi:hypothetical protein
MKPKIKYTVLYRPHPTYIFNGQYAKVKDVLNKVSWATSDNNMPNQI